MAKKPLLLIVQDFRTWVVLGTASWPQEAIQDLTKGKEIELFNQWMEIRSVHFNAEKTEILIKVKVLGEKQPSSFLEKNANPYAYLRKLESKIPLILAENKKTHISSIVKKGKSKIAQKFGEEAVELVIASGRDDDEIFKDEAADVFYYFLILLHERGFTMGDILQQLKMQNRKN